MTVKTDHDEYVKEHVDARVWLKDYNIQKIALFEPIIRDSTALQMNGEIAKMLKGVQRS